MQTSGIVVPYCRLFEEPRWLGFRHNGYDVTPLQDYFSTRNISDINSSGHIHLPEQSLQDMAASTQSWLTFGLIEAVTENQVLEDELLRKGNDGTLFLTTRNIPDIIQKWLVRITQTEPQSKKLWIGRARMNLREAHSQMMMLLSKGFNIFKPLGDHQSAMVMFIALVGEALSNTLKIFPYDDQQPPSGLSWSMVWVNEYREEYREAMIRAKWCPFTIEYLLNSKMVSSLKYASEYSAPSDGKHHTNCQKVKCMAYQIDERTYTQKHVESSCGPLRNILFKRTCQYAQPDLEKVIQHISHNEIPVICVNNTNGSDEGSSLSVDVLNSSDRDYIAISHVWADGLGSNTETGLPTCQLRRLAALVSKLYPGAAFWIDSLCIPEERESRKKAIKMMARIYKGATVVLVLDTGLQKCSSSESMGIKLLRVQTSGWMRRLWTLQEAILAEKIFFLFADDTQVPLTGLIPKSMDLALFPHLGDMAAEIFRLIKQSRYKSYNLGDISRSLRWRDTSRASDETLAIASLLNVDPGILIEQPAEKRIIKLLQELGKLPRNIAFLLGDKIDLPGFRWAPKSFMGAQGGSRGGLDLSTVENEAVITPGGLKAKYVAFYFPKRTVEVGSTWAVRDPKTMRLFEVRDLSSNSVGEKYECDMLLTYEQVPLGGAAPCITVLRTENPVKDEDDTFTVPCGYKKRVVLVDIMKDDKREAIQLQGTGPLKVCIS